MVAICSNSLTPERGEVVCALKRERGREFRAARRWSGPWYFRWCDNPSLRSNARGVRYDEVPATQLARSAYVDQAQSWRSALVRSVLLFVSSEKRFGA